MDALGWLLLISTAAWVLILGGIESWAAITNRPSISERIQGMGRAAPIVVIVVCTAAGILLDHFFGGH